MSAKNIRGFTTTMETSRGFATTNITSRGFTLIELMVVISVIAILAVVGMVMYTSVQRSARDTKRISDIDAIKNALEQYYTANKTYLIPTSNCANGCETTPSDGNIFTNIKADFSAQTIPTDPQPTVRNYRYYINNTSCTSPKYVLCAELENTSGGNTQTALPAGGNGAVGSMGNCATFANGTGAYCVRSNF